MKDKIWLSSPHMSGYEIDFVNEAFDTNWIAPLGPHVDGFEQDLSAFTGAAYAAALSSGTAAIHLALILLGVKSGDEVICQSFTFSASANPIIYQGATPIFIDSEPDSWNMSPRYLKTAILDRIAKSKKPKAIILVHLYGMPAKVSEIRAIGDEFEIPIIEDAAEALGSMYFGKPCGSLCGLGVLSFNGNKIITTSGGGALLSENELLIKQARFLATQARDQAPHYQHSQIGYNYRMSNICAAIGRGQMTVINDRVKQRRTNFEFYVKSLGAIQGISFLSEPEGFFSNRWLTCIIVDPSKTRGTTSEDIRIALDAKNIECRPLWKPMHLQPIFRLSPYYGEDISERLFENGLCLPSGSNLSELELNRIVQEIFNVFIQ